MSRGASDEGARSPLAQRRLSASRSARRGGGGGTAARGQVCIVATAGVPVSRTSGRIERPCCRRRTDGRHHIQTAGEHGARAPCLRAAPWAHARGNRHPGAQGIVRRLPSATWLSGLRVTAPFTLSLITRLIAYEPPSWPIPRKRSRPRTWGYTVGNWEGDTLVLDSISFVDTTWLPRGGFFHSDQMHVVEKFTRQGNQIKLSTKSRSKTQKCSWSRG